MLTGPPPKFHGTRDNLGEGIYRTDLSEPEWVNGLFKAVERWFLARLRQQLTDPHPLPYEADCFKETRPLATLEQAAAEAARRERPILAFVFDSERDDRSRLQWSLELFLHNRQTRDCMNTAFVTALVPLASFNDSSDYLRDQSMETARWVVLSRELKPLEQAVIYANAEERADHERIGGPPRQRG